MEKQRRSKKAVLSLISKTAAVAFSNPPFSPSRDKNSSRPKGHTGKGLSGSVVSIVPTEALRKSKNGSFHAQEPTSPKVSCIGQIKHKRKICQAKCLSPPTKDRKKVFEVGRMFRGAKVGRRKSDADANKAVGSDRTPSLGQMKRFATVRAAFANFNWKDGGDCCWDAAGDSDEEELREPCSAILGGGVVVEPRAELNLWKRRSVEPPRPLQLNVKKNMT